MPIDYRKSFIEPPWGKYTQDGIGRIGHSRFPESFAGRTNHLLR